MAMLLQDRENCFDCDGRDKPCAAHKRSTNLELHWDAEQEQWAREVAAAQEAV